MPAERCRYCLSEKVSISICLACQTKIDIQKHQMERIQRNSAYSRRAYFALSKENARLRKYIVKLEEGKKT